jgi:dihydropyrimidinase
MREWRSATEGDSAVDIGLSAVITAQQDDPVAELPALIDAGVPTFKAFMVYDFAIDDRTLLDALAVAQRSGGMLQVHCENAPILDANTARLLGERCTEPRFHAQCRPPYVEAEAVGRVAAYAHAVEARSYAVHLSSAAALDAIRAARSRGIDLVARRARTTSRSRRSATGSLTRRRSAT